MYRAIKVGVIVVAIKDRHGINNLISISKIRKRIHKIKNFMEKGERILETFSKPHSKADTLVGSDVPFNWRIELAARKTVARATLIKIINRHP